MGLFSEDGTLEKLFEGIPIVGSAFDEDEEKQRAKLKKLMSQSADRYSAMREPLRDARLKSLSQSLSLFQPYNNAIGDKYGSRYSFDYGNVLNDPLRGMETSTNKTLESDALEKDLARANMIFKDPKYMRDKKTIDAANRLYKKYGKRIKYNKEKRELEIVGEA